ncbi:Transglycosylase SLT domain-containing protein [bacterium A37T11]|nr:Transglycosylase SLT domain-containing protein [bacterium A37T11]
MIKKQLLSCSVLLLVMVLTKIFIFNSRASGNKYFHKTKTVTTEETEVKRNNPYYSSLTFAAEDLPLGDSKVENRMMRYMKAYSFKKLRSHRLHRIAQKYFPVIAPILRRYGIPEDFRYLPLVESGFETGTSSHKGASGYWQFMPQTAAAFGLNVDEGNDERQDIRKSTAAACKYLKVLYRQFNSWMLVAAAFNAGGGNLQKAIDRQGQDNLFKLKLNSETSSYIYKVISVKEVIENPTMHGYRPEYGKFIANLDAYNEKPKLNEQGSF